jgi:hypothetical protein
MPRREVNVSAHNGHRKFKKENCKKAAALFFQFSIFYLIWPSPALAANVYVSTTGSDSACARNDSTKPCASFNKAYSISQGGDTVEVAAGTYGSQSIPAASKGTSVVTFAPASGASVTLSDLSIDASYVEVQGMTASGGCDASAGASSQSDVTLRNMHCQTLYFSLTHF